MAGTIIDNPGLDDTDRAPMPKTQGASLSVSRAREIPVSTASGEITGNAGRPRLAQDKRITIMYALLACVASAAGAAWFVGGRIESPADVALRTAPPPPSPILVPVERRLLSSDVITRGTVRFGLPQQIAIAPSPLKTGPGLITSLPVKNTQINEGDVLLTASGRPVFVLLGQIPAYRDLTPRQTGDDVRQLKEALRRLGFDPGLVDGVYDQRTSAAVADLYKAKGWDAFGPTPDQLHAVRLLEREYADALKAKAAAEAAVTNAGLAVAAARAAAFHATRAAALESSVRTPDQNAPDRRGQSLAVQNERARAAHANTAAEAEVTALTADRALIVLDPRQPETARAAANAKLEVALAARERIRLEGELAIRNAEREASLTGERVEVARAAQYSARTEGERAIRAAQDGQRLAALDSKMASERADQAAADLEPARRKLGIQMPIDEFVFIRSLPVRVEEVTAAIGAVATGPLLSVTDNQLAIDSALPLDTAALVRPGMRVRIDEAALGIQATGVVETVAATPGTRNVDRFHVYLNVRVESTTTPLEGASVRLTIPTESTKGEVLAVPVSALSLTTDGTSRVRTRTANGLEYVTVRPGLSAGGYVEVAPLDATLIAGQLVVVGTEATTPRDTK